MGKPIEDGGAGWAGAGRCTECGNALRADQRYCFECGARQAPLPAVVASRIEALKESGRSDSVPASRGERKGEAAKAGVLAAGAAGTGANKDDKWWFMPSPQVAAVAVMALLAAGVVLGSVTSPLALSAGSAPIVLDLGEGSPPEESPEPEPAVTAAAPEAAAPTAVAPAPLAPAPEAPAPAPEPSAPPALPPELPEEETLPEIKHVFLIVLEGHGYEEAFGKASTAPYLATTLAGEGKLLTNYFAVTQGALANEVALLSGQGPTPQTALNCPEYTPIAPGTLSAEGQVEGQGCVYPAGAETLPGQLAAAGLAWKAYVEPGALEPWRNPFDYFASLHPADGSVEGQVGLEQLPLDLKKAEKTPTLSYIVPNACHDGGETPCEPGQPAGLAAADPFLETVVPEITASPAYKEEGGLIAITFDQAPQAGPSADSSSCCATPEYPNLPAPASAEPLASGPVKPSGGGGRVGLLLISPYLAPGTIEESSYYNHYSLLRSIEELLGQEPLGYAAEPALSGFEASLFDASPEESSVSPKG